MQEYLLLVHTSGHAFSIEKLVKKRGIACKVSPIPRNVSSDCGVCLRFEEPALEAVKELVSALPFEIQSIIPTGEAQ